MVAWAHYVQYPVVLGLSVAYVIVPRLRGRYLPRQFLLDQFLQFGLVALCIPQVLALWGRRGTLVWIDQRNYLAFLVPLIALLPAIFLALVEPLRRRDTDDLERAVRQSLLICLVIQIATLEVAALAGTNLLNWRYFISSIIPGVLLAGAALARASKSEAAIVVLGFTFITAWSLISAKRTTGTFSGIGYEDWRGAVTELSARISSDPDPVVFFRSGFVEEDAAPLGSPPAATRAPLRSPGRQAFAAPVTSLTFRWGHPAREAYFEQTVRPLVTGTSHFFLLSARGAPGGVNYPDQFVRWVETKWPASFAPACTSFGVVELCEFRHKER